MAICLSELQRLKGPVVDANHRRIWQVSNCPPIIDATISSAPVMMYLFGPCNSAMFPFFIYIVHVVYLIPKPHFYTFWGWILRVCVLSRGIQWFWPLIDSVITHSFVCINYTMSECVWFVYYWREMYIINKALVDKRLSFISRVSFAYLSTTHRPINKSMPLFTKTLNLLNTWD
jgi:hypothetical protein